MNRLLKRITACCLSVLLLLTLFPAVAAADDPVYSGSCGENAVWSFDPGTGTLTISGYGEMYNYAVEYGEDWIWYSSVPWYNLREEISSVIIQDGITSVCPYAFLNCNQLMNITLPNGLRDLKNSIFYNCISLVHIELPNSITEIGSLAFADCTALESVELPDSISSIGWGAFRNCTALQHISLPQQLLIINGDTFKGCASLKSISIPDDVTEIGERAFQDCTALETVELSQSLKTICQEAFDHCSAMQSVTLPDSLTDIQTYAFYCCANLENVSAGSNIQHIGVYAFAETALMNDKEKWDAGALYIGDWLVAGDRDAVECHIREGTKGLADGAFRYCYSLESVEIPEGIKKITAKMFYDCRNLKRIALPESLEEVYIDAFTGVTNADVYIPNLTAWCNCTFFNGYYLYGGFGIEISSNPMFSSTASAGRLYVNGTLIEQLTIPEGITTIKPSAFNGCQSIKAASFPSGVTTIGEAAFMNCRNMKEVSLSDTVTEISRWAFWGCERMESLVIPNSVINIEVGAFGNCTGLKNLVIGDGVSELTFDPSDYVAKTVFYNCKNLESITIGRGVKDISASHFPGCDRLETVTILNPSCVIEYDKNTLGVPGQTVIYGYKDSTAEYYAKAFAYTFVPIEEPHVHSYTDTVTPPTCTEQGYTTHTCECGDSYTDSYVPALGHDWNAPTYTWAEDYSAVTATRTCKRDEAHTETETASASFEITKEATYEAEGEIVYTAVFENAAFVTQTKTVTTPKLEKPDDPKPDNPFTDLAEGAYYYNAVLWAVNTSPQITAGTSATTFSPNAACTRAQVVTFLWRAAGAPEPTITSNPFTDVIEGTYYTKAVLWAVENGITAGTAADKFSPDVTCTRGQIVTFLWRYEDKPEPGTAVNPFTDVKPGAYYETAVLWAAGAGVTAGTSATAFSPDTTCTRGQVVTFLYRDMTQN